MVQFTLPTSGDPAGGTEVVLSGVNFGRSVSDIANVTIGEQPCLNVSLPRDGEIQCRVPPGVGANLNVRIVMTNGIFSPTNDHWSYFAPEVTAVDPVYAMPGPAEQAFDIVGNYFGLDAVAIQSGRMGGVPCGNVLLMPSNMSAAAGLLPISVG